MARSGMNTSGSDFLPDAPKPKLTKEAFQRGLRIFRYVLPYRAKFIAGMVLLTLSSATFMAFPWVAGKLVDAANGKIFTLFGGLELTITRIALLLFCVILFQGFFRSGASGFSRR